MNESYEAGTPRCPGWQLRVILFLCLGGLPLGAGCGDANKLGRLGISGRVTLDGQPLDAGTIEFSPKDPLGVSTGGTIVDGAYRIAAAAGVPAGKYVVRITSPRDNVAADQPEELLPPGPQQRQGPRQPPPATERVPAEYNTKSKQIVEVTKQGPNQFDFAIPIGKKP